MTHTVSMALRPGGTRFLILCTFLPALFLLLPFAASASAIGAPPEIAPVRISDPQTVTREADGDDFGQIPAPDDAGPASVTVGQTGAALGPVKISISPAPFMSITSGDQIIREFVVRNDSDAPIDVTFIMGFNVGWRDNCARSVRTSRKIPARSIQTVPLFVPSAAVTDSESIDVVNPRIFVNGKPFQNPLGIFDIGGIDWHLFTAPSSFTTMEPLARVLVRDLVYPLSPRFRSFGEFQVAFSDSDTLQWPSIPQFYQAKDVFFRKTTDKFNPDAERAIRDAVMLGATEFLFVPRGSQRPEWAPQPSSIGLPVVVPRGFGRTIVMDERYVFNQNQRPDTGAPGDDDEKTFRGNRRNNDAEMEAAGRANRRMLDYLKSENIFIVNPSVLCQMLPNIDIPNLSFAMVLLALLAYIIVVGPVNYFYLIKRKKSVLMLLLTVPVISLIFVGVVILFVTFFEGWFSRASAVGMTFLDQQESMAYTRAAVNLYAPVPVRKLVFDPSDTVSFARAREANVSLGRDQVITGANKARVPLIYGVSRAEKRLEQLKVSRSSGDSLSVVNGLGAPVKILALKTPDGKCWIPPEDTVQPGVSAELEPAAGSPESSGNGVGLHNLGNESFDVKGFGRDQLFYTVAMVLFEESEYEHGGNTARRMIGTRNNLYSFRENASNVREVFERKDSDEFVRADEETDHGTTGSTTGAEAGKGQTISQPPFSAVLAPGMYVVETDRPLFYTPGCSPVSFRARHIVVGTFTLQESAHEN